MVAENDETLMEKFFEAGTLADDELVSGLRGATIAGKVFPLVCTSALLNIGVPQLLDAILAYLPSPADRPFKGIDKEHTEVARPANEKDVVSAFVESPTFGGNSWLAHISLLSGLEIRDEVDERYDPLKATEAACKFLKKAHDKFGNWTLAAASYDRGMAGLDRALENQRVKTYYDLFLNDETGRYVFRMLAIKEIMEHPAKYGFDIGEKAVYKLEPVRYVEVNETVKDLVDFSIANGTSYKLLKRFNPWLRDEKLTVKKGKVYKIALPAS